MWNGFCGELLRKTNRRLLIVVLVVAAGLALFFGAYRTYFHGFFAGPHTASSSELLAATSEKAFSNSIVTVDGGATAGTALYETKTDKTHPEGYTSARFIITQIGGNRRMLVRVSPDDPMALAASNAAPGADVPGHPAMSLTGEVIALTPDLSQKLSAATAAGDEVYLPYLLDMYDYKTFGWTSVIIGGICLLLALWGAFTYLRRNSDPTQDSFSRALAKYGALESVVPQVDNEMAMAHSVITRKGNTVHIGQTWFVAATPFRAYGARLDSLVWAYRLIVKRKMYGVITVGTRHTLMAYDRYGQRISVQLDEAKTAEALQFLRNAAPQAIFGYDKRLQKLWNAGKGSDRTAFITEAQGLLAGQLPPDAVTRKQFHA